MSKITIVDVIRHHDGHRFQRAFGELVAAEKPSVVVETGVSSGGSTGYILAALHSIGQGVLHSVDPEPSLVLEDPRWTLWREKSVVALPKIYAETGPWDIFLHDSDHEIYCQTWEYELAWHFLAPGGILATDDPIWGIPPHDAWKHFCERHGVTPTKLGTVDYVRKNEDTCVRPSEIGSVLTAVNQLALRMTASWEVCMRTVLGGK